MEPIQVWQTIVLPFASAAFGGFLSAGFAVVTFRRQKVWERKTAAYTAIFEAMHDMEKWFAGHSSALEEGRKLDDDRKEKLASEYRVGRESMLRKLASESWLLPDRCLDRLKTLDDQLNQHADDFFEEVGYGSEALASAQDDLREMVRKDLGLNSTYRIRSGLVRLHRKALSQRAW